MCLHLTICCISRFRKNSDPGHEHNEAWQLRTYGIAGGVLMSMMLLLIALSLVLEFGRERQWTTGLAHSTRSITALPLVGAVVLLLVIILEAICLYPTIVSLIRISTQTGSAEPTVIESIMGANHT